MEMIMSTISNAPAVAQDMVEESTGSGPLATLTGWSVAYITWRTEQGGDRSALVDDRPGTQGHRAHPFSDHRRC